MKRSLFALPLAQIAASLVLLCAPAHAADPTTADCLAASDASLKLGNEHKLRAERAQLLMCAASSCPSDVRKECIRRVDEVNAAIPTIVFEAKDASGNDLSAVKVTMDGEVLAEQLVGTALSIDPGQHIFTFETAGQPTLQKQFVIRESQKDRRESISFGGPTTTQVAAPTQMGEPMPSAPPTPERSRGLGSQKTVAIVAGGVGVVGLGVGSAFGLVAMSKKSDAKNVCPDQCADQSGVNKWSDAKSAGNVSTVAFVVGGVAVAGAAVLWFTAKPEGSDGPSAEVGFGLGTVQLKGVW